ncbi:MAG: alanine racemase [Mycobacterium sp.]
MFLSVLRRRNPGLISAAIELHQAGHLPANTFVLDLDAIEANARIIATEAARLSMTPYAMTKQIGRNPDACRAIIAGGIPASVAVDVDCASSTTKAGMRLGHVGHLVQIPRAEADLVAGMRPEHWTVFSSDKAAEAAAASCARSRDQALLARIHAPGDEFYTGHEGGFGAEDILQVADELDSLAGAHFAGITTFPALLFDPATGTLRTTHNLRTLQQVAARLAASGRTVEINGPGTTSAMALAMLASAGVTQVEPGHALTGTTPAHVGTDLPEIPAACYLTEVSHHYAGRAYCFGGGLYVDPVFPDYQITAEVGPAPGETTTCDATLPAPSSIDYYGQLSCERYTPRTGDSVVFGFRIQAFVTRGYTAGVAGISTGNPTVAGIWSGDGMRARSQNAMG